ncbi:hypothetical protein BDV25DRAFT_131052 [Aspergillus avenaceus]|uniref:Uncharacterized protein n=1 Tax=Aspergillus avenaceus TaxID=36643 RepID=A0A5N6TQQ9_ASPAV|nr:hypothetical protein BDV25DRAFT_131052 [Aspergillus avenaceus]
MSSVAVAPLHRQICLSTSCKTGHGQPAPMKATEAHDCDHDTVMIQEILQSSPHPICGRQEETLCTHPILTDDGFVSRLTAFHVALVKATVNVVDRWWQDTTAHFPGRMPLEPPVENVLQVPFENSLGIWRPDILLTGNEGSSPGPGFRLCEINSRSPSHAVIRTAGQKHVLQQLLGTGSTFSPGGNMDELLNGVLSLFNAELPIHWVRGRDSLDRTDFIQAIAQKTGLHPRYITIDDLRLEPDSSSITGYALYCAGEGIHPEKVHQVALSLFPDEFALLSGGMLRHLATISVNDFRVSLLVNDQRFLGILLQELDGLVQKQQVLTPNEAQLLRDGIVPTLLPGSPELQQWVQRSRRGDVTKDDYILKAARLSLGHGHLIGEEVPDEQWDRILLSMKEPTIRLDQTTYVLQQFIQQPTFDLLVDKHKMENGSRMIGAYYTINGRFVGLGPWRAGKSKICNFLGGGCTCLYSVIPTGIDPVIS